MTPTSEDLITWSQTKDPRWRETSSSDLARRDCLVLVECMNGLIQSDWGEGINHLSACPAAGFLLADPLPSHISVTPLMRAAALAKPSATRVLSGLASSGHLVQAVLVSTPSPSRPLSMSRARVKTLHQLARRLHKVMMSSGELKTISEKTFIQSVLDTQHLATVEDFVPLIDKPAAWSLLLSQAQSDQPAVVALALRQIDWLWRVAGLDGLSKEQRHALWSLACDERTSHHVPILASEVSRQDLIAQVSGVQGHAAPSARKKKI